MSVEYKFYSNGKWPHNLKNIDSLNLRILRINLSNDKILHSMKNVFDKNDHIAISFYFHPNTTSIQDRLLNIGLKRNYTLLNQELSQNEHIIHTYESIKSSKHFQFLEDLLF